MRLRDILNKIGVGFETLNPSEQDTLKQWEEQWKSQGLEEEMSVEKIQEFLKKQIWTTENEFWNANNSDKKDQFLKAHLKALKTLLNFIEFPKRSEEAITKELKDKFE